MVELPLVFRTHAIRRMLQRRVDIPDVRHVLATGEVIEEYPDDTPYPSRLVLGWRGSRPLPVVAAGSRAPRNHRHHGLRAQSG